jgi:hypothetical protein
VDISGPKWTEMDKSGPKWTEVGDNGYCSRSERPAFGPIGNMGNT